MYYLVVENFMIILLEIKSKNMMKFEKLTQDKDNTGQGHDCTIGCLIDYQYFKEYYQLIVVDLSKQALINYTN